MGGLTPYVYGEHQIRIVERDREAWFVAADVCAVLEIANPRDAVSRLDADERDGVGITDTIGREQRINIVSEPGLYALILRSRKPEAKKFSRWVRHEVLPIIRRTGGYGADRMSVAEKLKLLTAAERLGGKLAARSLWSELGLPPLTIGPAPSLPDAILRRVPASGSITRRALHRSVRPLVPARVFDEVVGTLVEQGRVVAKPTEPGRVGRPSLVFSLEA